jgi:endonuclease YncB( thermonuclease family)
MKNILISLLLSLASVSAFSADMIMPIRGVADGDTIRSSLKLPCPLCNVSVRILDIDTPESTYLAKCDKEKALGLEAKRFLTKLVVGKETMMARSIKWDKYGGRINAHVELDGVNVGDLMITLGYAKRYTGVGPKPNWCE